LTLTPEQAIEMLEQLRPYVVLGAWRQYKQTTMWRRFILPSNDYAAFVSEVETGIFRADLSWEIFGEAAFISGTTFDTPELAMQAVDAHLATLPNVLALGVTPKGEMK